MVNQNFTNKNIIYYIIYNIQYSLHFLTSRIDRYMGNCYEDTRVMPSSSNQIQQKQPNLSNINSNQRSQISNSNIVIVSQLRGLPPISKVILHRMEQLGPFLNKSQKQIGKIYQLKNNTVYQGPLKNKIPEGLGRLLLNDGTVIQSQFQNGLPRGKTRIFKTNGDYFCGVITDPDKTYTGIVNEKGIIYEGQMLNQKPHGFGKQRSKSYSFEGTYVDGKKTHGVFKWNIQDPKNEQSYQGSFVNSFFQGQGVLVNNEGKYIGNFQRGVKTGQGIMQYRNGQKYEGSFRRNKPDGNGKLSNMNGIIKEGIWINGKYYIGESQ